MTTMAFGPDKGTRPLYDTASSISSNARRAQDRKEEKGRLRIEWGWLVGERRRERQALHTHVLDELSRCERLPSLIA
jgi:hypothetical protein